MRKYTNVKMIVALDQCATSRWLIKDAIFLSCDFPVFFVNMQFAFFFRAYGSGKEDSPLCDVPGFENYRMKLLRHVSFVDCPVSV